AQDQAVAGRRRPQPVPGPRRRRGHGFRSLGPARPARPAGQRTRPRTCYTPGVARRGPRVDATDALTALLQAWRSGDADARAPLNQQIYATLKRMARQRVGPG